MNKLIDAFQGIEELKEREWLENKLCQIIQLIKEADSDMGKSKLMYEYNYKKLNIRIIYEYDNYYQGMK